MRNNKSTPKSKTPAPFFLVLQGGKRVMLEDHAREAGRQNLPAPDATSPNEFETGIILQGEQDHSVLVERSQAELQAQLAILERAESQLPTPSDLSAVVDKADAEIEHDLVGNTSLARRYEDYDAQDGTLRVFVRKNAINREPQYPKSMIWHTAIIGAIFVAEAAANASFFAKGNEFGFLGGFLFAAAIAAVNVIGAILVGRLCLPYLNHVEPVKRQRALVGFIAYILVVVSFNLVVAHFRDSYVASNGAIPDSFGGLLRSPFDLSFDSGLMFFVGLLACGLACREGYTADDRYPGYGKLHKEYLKARNAYEQEKTRALDQVLGREKAVPPACDALVRKAEGLAEEMSRALVAAQKVADEYEAGRAQLEDETEIYLRKYRDENKVVRRARHAPAPAYFEEFPTLPELLDIGVVDSMSQRLQFARSAVETLKEKALFIKGETRARVTDVSHRFEEFLETRLPKHGAPSNGEQAGEVDRAIGGARA